MQQHFKSTHSYQWSWTIQPKSQEVWLHPIPYVTRRYVTMTSQAGWYYFHVPCFHFKVLQCWELMMVHWHHYCRQAGICAIQLFIFYFDWLINETTCITNSLSSLSQMLPQGWLSSDTNVGMARKKVQTKKQLQTKITFTLHKLYKLGTTTLCSPLP